MSASDILPQIIRSAFTQSPVIVVCLTGSVLVFVRWRPLQRSALPSFLGFVLGLILSLAGPLVWAILPQAMTGKSAAEMTALFAVVGFVQSLCWAAVLASLGLGILLGRAPAPPRMP
jgi:hypothetical protein